MSSSSYLLRLACGPLALEEGMRSRVADMLMRHNAGEEFTLGDVHAAMGLQEKKPSSGTRVADGIALIPILDMIAQRPTASGLASTDVIGAQFDAAMASPAVGAIVLDVDSPGGAIEGVPELAAKIFAARGKGKPIIAVAKGMMASAAYWIGSAADEVVVTPSSLVGSIGVRTIHEDHSRRLEQEGVKITSISAGQYKTEGAPWEPLSEEARSVLEDRVQEAYGWFVKAVATHRGDTQTNVRNGYGEGRVLGAAQAVKARLADRIGTLETTVVGVAQQLQRSPRRGPRADFLMRKLELDSTDIDF